MKPGDLYIVAKALRLYRYPPTGSDSPLVHIEAGDTLLIIGRRKHTAAWDFAVMLSSKTHHVVYELIGYDSLPTWLVRRITHVRT